MNMKANEKKMAILKAVYQYVEKLALVNPLSRDVNLKERLIKLAYCFFNLPSPLIIGAPTAGNGTSSNT